MFTSIIITSYRRNQSASAADVYVNEEETIEKHIHIEEKNNHRCFVKNQSRNQSAHQSSKATSWNISRLKKYLSQSINHQSTAAERKWRNLKWSGSYLPRCQKWNVEIISFREGGGTSAKLHIIGVIIEMSHQNISSKYLHLLYIFEKRLRHRRSSQCLLEKYLHQQSAWNPRKCS